jgi:LmbE family N-acetylglucosaminyl deacetylase
MMALGLPEGPLRVVCLGAHCDDIEIGAGGTLLRLLAEHPGSVVEWLVLCSDSIRRAEEKAASTGFAASAAELRVRIESFPENVLPSMSAEIQMLIGSLAGGAVHDLVICPAEQDRHQDHRLVAQIAHQKWRNHPIWGYEIAKWDSDLTPPNLFVRLSEEVVEHKLDLLDECFPSQHSRSWFDREAFAALLRIRGVECAHRYAEAFHVRKTAI